MLGAESANPAAAISSALHSACCMRISLTFLLADLVMLMRAQQRNVAVRNSTEK